MNRDNTNSLSNDMEKLAIIEVIFSMQGEFDEFDVLHKCTVQNVYADKHLVLSLINKLTKQKLLNNNTFSYSNVENSKDIQKLKDKVYSSLGYEKVDNDIKSF